MNWSLGAALVMGLVGSLHCVGMCGGSVLAVGGAFSAAKAGDQPKSRPLSHVAYHLGRLITYTSLGVAVGAGGFFMTGLVGAATFHRVAMVFMVVIFAGVALHLMGLIPITGSDKIGRGFADWLGKLLRGASGLPGAYLLGVLTGFLPCGLLYGALAMAVSTASPLWGGAVMATFWAGTVPLLFVVGHSGHMVIRRLRGNAVFVSGLLILGLAIGFAASKLVKYNPAAKCPHCSSSPASQTNSPLH